MGAPTSRGDLLALWRCPVNDHDLVDGRCVCGKTFEDAFDVEAAHLKHWGIEKIRAEIAAITKGPDGTDS